MMTFTLLICDFRSEDTIRRLLTPVAVSRPDEPLGHLIARVFPELSGLNLTYFNNQARRSIDSSDAPDCATRYLCAILPPETALPVDKAELESIVPALRSRLRLYLDSGEMFGTRWDAAEISNRLELPIRRDFVPLGISSFDIINEDTVEQSDNSTDNDSAVRSNNIRIMLSYYNDVQVTLAEIQHDSIDEKQCRLLEDICPEDHELNFDRIHSAVILNRTPDRQMLLQVSGDIAGKRLLKTFEKVEPFESGTATDLFFRDTGNRIKQMSYIKILPLPRLDFNYIGEANGLDIPGFLIEKVQAYLSTGHIICDIEKHPDEGYLVLSWVNTETAVISHVSHKHEKILNSFKSEKKPHAFVWLNNLQAFILAFDSDHDLFILEPDTVETRRVGTLLTEQCATQGDVRELYCRQEAAVDVLLVVRSRSINLFFLKSILHD